MSARLASVGCLGAVLLAVSLTVAVALPPVALASPPTLNAAALSWSRLVFRAAGREKDLSVEIRLSEVSPAELASVLNSSLGDSPAPPVGGAVLQMTSIFDVFLTGRTYRTDVWFQPDGISPLQRRRDKMGRDADRKVFHYLADGVQRLRIKPENRAEAELSPEEWSSRKERFFPFGPARGDCPVLSDPSLLLPIASAGLVEDAAPMTLCVFNKKTIHGVRLSAETAGSLTAEYLASNGATRSEVQGSVPIRKVRIESWPPKDAGSDPEPFEFFEMKGTFEIDLDAESGLPLRILGEIASYGRVELTLSQADLRP